MIFHGTYQTGTGLETESDFPRIDYLEFEFPDPPQLGKYIPADLKKETGIWLSCDWDSSEWNYDPKTGKGSFRCKGVNINEIPANGAAELFRGAKLIRMQFYAPYKPDYRPSWFKWDSFEVEDADISIEIPLKAMSGFELDVISA